MNENRVVATLTAAVGLLVLLIGAGAFVIIQPTMARVHWGDERTWCKFARSNNIRAAAVCPNLKDGCCSLNGAEAKSPCAFDEPPDAAIWNDIRESVAEYRKKGWI